MPRYSPSRRVPVGEIRQTAVSFADAVARKKCADGGGIRITGGLREPSSDLVALLRREATSAQLIHALHNLRGKRVLHGFRQGTSCVQRVVQRAFKYLVHARTIAPDVPRRK